jgi:cytochrome c biogenesis protein ResB
MQAGKDIKLSYEYVPGRIKQFESDIVILENGKETASGTISVNNPFVWKGWKFFQSGYDERNLRLSVLQISTDPGKYVVEAGFFLLLAGLAWAFMRPRKGENNA